MVKEAIYKAYRAFSIKIVIWGIYISNLLGVLYFESSALSRFLLYQYETELARLSTGVMETETGTTFKIQNS